MQGDPQCQTSTLSTGNHYYLTQGRLTCQQRYLFKGVVERGGQYDTNVSTWVKVGLHMVPITTFAAAILASTG
jgi:hypothetical protein